MLKISPADNLAVSQLGGVETMWDMTFKEHGYSKRENHQPEIRCKSVMWPSVPGGQRPIGVDLNGRCSPCRPLRPWLKLPTQSQMANGNLKVCVQNAKLLFT